MYSERKTPFRSDFDVLLGVPEQLLIEFGERCGQNTENEPLPARDGQTRTLRHLTSLDPSGIAPWDEKTKSVLYLEQSERVQGRWAGLYYFTYFSREESLEYPIDSDLKLHISKNLVEEQYSEPKWEFSVSMDFKYSTGFNLTWYGAHWPLVSAMMNRFAELTKGFPREVRISDGRVLSGVED